VSYRKPAGRKAGREGNRVVKMGIYRFRFDIVDSGIKIRAQARSPRGTMFTCDSVVVPVGSLDRAGKAAAIEQAIDAMVAGQRAKRS
jgi:hypothetical protein